MPEPLNKRKARGRFHGFAVFCLKTAAVVTFSAGAVGLWQYQSWKAKARTLDYRRLKEMESASLILDRNGELIGRIFIKNRDEKPLSELSKNLQQAVVSMEDSRFRSHSGVDFPGIIRAVLKNLKARKGREGASTLTQQLARNTFTEELPSRDRSIRRKLLEMFVAWEVERRLSKDEILELYLNRVFFGSGFYGAEAAAQGYFGKAAKDLSVAESALLAGLLRSPNQLSPWRNRKACVDARNYVLLRMRDLGAITAEKYRESVEEEPIVKNKRSILQESYFAGMVSSQMSKLVGLESAVSEGYRIYTTIDLSLQKKAEAALQKQLEAIEKRPDFQNRQTYATFDPIYRAWKRRVTAAAASGADGTPGQGAEEPSPRPEYIQGAALVVDNATGAIRALVGGRDAQHSEFNRVTQSKKPPGSAFKPIVYASAFEHGLHPWSVVQDEVMDNRKVMVGGTSGILGEWARESEEGKVEGLITAKSALSKSKNAATVRLGMQIGTDLKSSLESVISLSAAAGIQSQIRAYPATFLGSSEVSLNDLTLAYTCFPGGGTRPKKTFLIDRIENNSGKVIYKEAPTRQAVMKPGAAFQVHECLTSALTEGTGARAFEQYGLKRMPLAGKTGTAYDFTDVWFVGYSSELTCGVWTGFDKSRTPIFFGAFSRDIALPAWTEIMNHSFAQYPARPFTRPDDLRRCQICSKSGYTLLPSCVETKKDGMETSTATEAWLTASQMPLPDETCDVHGPKRPKRRSGEDGAQPRVELAIDLKSVASVAIKSPTVLGEDPFQSDRSEQAAKTLRNFRESGRSAPLDNRVPDSKTAGSKEEPEVEIPKVQAVRPGDSNPTKPVTPAGPALPKLEF